MTKTKAQLRAEAVERLRWFESSDEGDGYYWDVTRALLGKRPTEYDDSDELVSALTDLLTDDCGPCYSCAKLAELMAENNALREIVGDLKVPTDPGKASMMSVDAFIKKQTEHESRDSREKLEADVERLIGKIQERIFSGRDAGALRFQMRELLDRQAAITDRECIGKWDMTAALRIAEQDRRIVEYAEKLEELERENERLRDFDGLREMANIAKGIDVEDVGNTIAELQAKVDELTERQCPGYEPESHHCRYHHQDFELNHQTVSRLKRENANLARDLGECMAENAELKAGLLPQSDDEGLA